MKILQFIINELYWIARILTSPTCWLRNSFTNKKWDLMVLSELQSPSFTNRNNYDVTLNGRYIWIENRYYDCVCDGVNGPIPSRRTVFKFFDALNLAETEK